MAASERDELAEALAAHHAHVGPVSGAWLCACGAESTNGSIRTGDLTRRADRCAEHDTHVAAALLDWLAQRDRRVAAEVLRRFSDSRGVNVGDEEDDYWRGYRQAQRECLHDAVNTADRIERGE